MYVSLKLPLENGIEGEIVPHRRMKVLLVSQEDFNLKNFKQYDKSHQDDASAIPVKKNIRYKQKKRSFQNFRKLLF